MSEQYLLEQVELLTEDDKVLDFVLSIKDEERRTSILKALDSYRGHDSFLVIKDEDDGKIKYHIIIKSADREDPGLILYSSDNHEALIFYLGQIIDKMPNEFREDYQVKVIESTRILREMAQKK